MGHYCYECGEKLAGGVTPTCCDCIECFCWGCWQRLIHGTMSDQLQQNIKKDIIERGTLSEKTSEDLKVWTQKEPQCPECKTVLDEDMFHHY